MDIFKFNNPMPSMLFQGGTFIKRPRSVMWVERYGEAGEFSISDREGSGLKDILPIDSFISHTNTKTIMYVENHSINNGTIEITGRSIESFLENRIVGSNKTFPTSTPVTEFLLSSGLLHIQIRDLIRFHTYRALQADPNNAIDNLDVVSTVSGPGTVEERDIQRSDLYGVVEQLLKIDSLGIRINRPRTSSLGTNPNNTVLEIYKGVDRSGKVIFSYDSGDLENAEYLWSTVDKKDSAYIFGKWVETVVVSPLAGYNRKWVVVDARDIDSNLNEAPVGLTRTNIINKMQVRGQEELAKANGLALINADASKLPSRVIFRKDYDVGDLVTVVGEYGASSKKRVQEYVEIEDDTGSSGYPTFSDLEE